MSSLAMFDLAVSSTPAPSDVPLAERLAESALSEIRYIRELDDSFAASSRHSSDRGVMLMMRAMYEEWARQAEATLQRIERVERSGVLVASKTSLDHEYGRTMAMLSVSIEDHDISRAQIERGEIIPMEVLRNDLRARLQRGGV